MANHKPNRGSVFAVIDNNGRQPSARGDVRVGLSDRVHNVTLWPSKEFRPHWDEFVANLPLEAKEVRFQITLDQFDNTSDGMRKRFISGYNNAETHTPEDDRKYQAFCTLIEGVDPDWMLQNVDGWKIAA